MTSFQLNTTAVVSFLSGIVTQDAEYNGVIFALRYTGAYTDAKAKYKALDAYTLMREDGTIIQTQEIVGIAAAFKADMEVLRANTDARYKAEYLRALLNELVAPRLEALNDSLNTRVITFTEK